MAPSLIISSHSAHPRSAREREWARMFNGMIRGGAVAKKAFSQWAITHPSSPIHHDGELGLNLYLYQHDRKSFGNRQRISIVSLWKEQGLSHWKGFHIHNWLWPESLCSFPRRLITITQSDNRLLSQSPKLSFQQRLLGGEIASHIAPRRVLRTYTLSQMASEIRALSTIQ